MGGSNETLEERAVWPCQEGSCYMKIEATMWAWGTLSWPLSQCKVGFYSVLYIIRGRDGIQHERLIQDEIMTMGIDNNDYAHFR